MSRKNANTAEDVPVERACLPVPPCITVAISVVPVSLCFPPSRSSPIHLPSPSQQAPVDKKRAEKVPEKEQQNLTINQILPFVIPNIGPIARNGDWGETTDGGQRETKRRGRKHEDPAELTFVYWPLFYCCCIICEPGRQRGCDRCYSL